MAQFNRQSSRGGLGQLGLAALILAGVAVNKGENYRYPFSLRLIK